MAARGDTTPASELPEGFDEHYHTVIGPELDRAEGQRRAAMWRMALLCAAILLDLMAMMWFSDRNIDNTLVLLIGVAVAALPAWGIVLTYQHMRRLAKAALVEPTCHFLGYEYSPSAADFPLHRFYDLRLLRRREYKTRTRTEDEIRGTHNGVPFRLCEVEIKDKRQRKNDDDNDSKKTNILFRGILFITEFPHPFSGETRLLNAADPMPKTTLDGTSMESVHLEGSGFSQGLHIYSSDPTQARSLLTPAFMNRLEHLTAHFSHTPKLPEEVSEIEQSPLFQKLKSLTNTVSVAFVDQQMLISIRTGENRFEGGSVFKSLKNRDRVEKLLVELRVVPEILDALELDTDVTAAAERG